MRQGPLRPRGHFRALFCTQAGSRSLRVLLTLGASVIIALLALKYASSGAGHFSGLVEGEPSSQQENSSEAPYKSNASVLTQAVDKAFPADSGIIDVKKEYGAKGDGVSDDTQAIQNAINENIGKEKILYLSSGTYLVSDRLEAKDSSGEWHNHLDLQGQSQEQTVI